MQKQPTLKDLQKLCPHIEQEFLREHLSRLSERYFRSFTEEEIREHLNRLYTLSHEHPCECILLQENRDTISCTIFAFDHPALFSILTGLLAANGFNIISGDIFTYSRRPSQEKNRRTRPGRYKSSLQRGRETTTRRRIIDHFRGELVLPVSFQQWKQSFTDQLQETLSIIEEDRENGLEKAREQVQDAVVEALVKHQFDYQKVLYPVTIEELSTSEERTRMKVEAEDTPFFLFSLSNALALHEVSIERVQIRTIGNRVEDDFEFVDLSGKPINDQTRINHIKLSILFTKQFTYFLGRASDPHRALVRFESIIQDISQLSESGVNASILSEPKVLQDLARLLGASDFLWEDFIRLQYESILPMLNTNDEQIHLSHTPAENRAHIQEQLSSAATPEEAKQILNEFKDREIYLIDLDHILNPKVDFLELSRRLTELAELVVDTSVEVSYRFLRQKYGVPQTVAGLETHYAVLGLGKMGGAALGYASDIELMFVYSDNGETSAEESITNAEFFERLFRNAVNMIEAKQKGIFRVDLRLRPYGSSGPLAVSLETFCDYYGPTGGAHSFELLALIRMRTIGGDREFGERIERLRDEMVYASNRINLQEIKALREKQLAEKTRPGKANVKFSPGGLVDLEYTVQILQCVYGKENPDLRTPRIHIALTKLKEAGILEPDETEELIQSYHFLRNVTNSLRMLRGSAEDLFLPDVRSDEFMHLARRAGYTWQDGFSPSQRLRLEFETRTASIRTFIEAHLGRESIPGPPTGNAADLVLSTEIPSELEERILEEGGFKNISRARENIRILSGDQEQRTLFARLAVLAWDILRNTPDPDMALNNWERFVSALDRPIEHYRDILSQPKRLEILLGIFSGSHFLSDTLIAHPEFFDWVSTPEHIHPIRSRSSIENDLRSLSASCTSRDQWREELRRFRKREILRIGTRDICLKVPVQDVYTELTNLAEAIIEISLWRTTEELYPGSNPDSLRFCILAFGKLGGRELNYSSDIDLLGTYDPHTHAGPLAESASAARKKQCKKIMEQLRSDLSDHTPGGYVYRVDLRLRPFGKAGLLVGPVGALVDYYTRTAALWEFQALLKLRPVAGHQPTGTTLLASIKPLLFGHWQPSSVIQTVRDLRDQANTQKLGANLSGYDIKTGAGGIRDIEFTVQALQLIHIERYPEVVTANTVEAIHRLRDHEIITAETASHLENDYLFLRRLEHFLQILEDRQIHATPIDQDEREALSKRLLGPDADPDRLREHLDSVIHRVRETTQSVIANWQHE